MLRPVVTAVVLLAAVLCHASHPRRVIYNDVQTGFSFFNLPAASVGEPLKLDSPAEVSVACGEGDLSFSVRLRNSGDKKTRLGYMVYWLTAANDTLRLEMHPLSGDDPLRDSECSRLTIFLNSEKLGEAILPRNKFDNGQLYNTLRLQRTGRDISVHAGRMVTDNILSFPRLSERLPGGIVAIGIAPAQGNSVEIDRLQLAIYPSASHSLQTELNAQAIGEILKDEGTDSAYGFWTLLDFDLDDRYVRTGGDYRLAILPLEYFPGKIAQQDYPDNSLAVVYLDGAQVDSDRWEEGMLKGILIPTAFQNVWRLIWFDSEGEPMESPDLPVMSTATLDGEGRILTLSFPDRYSSLRLHRLPF